MNPASIPRETLVEGYLWLLTEALEGPQEAGSAFLDQGSGLLPTLAAITPEQASTPPAPGLTTIAAHAEHSRFHLAATNAFARGEPQTLDWAESWKLQQVDEAAWAGLQEALQNEYQAFRELVENLTTWDENAVGGALGALAHVSYHLGAIRLLVRLTERA